MPLGRVWWAAIAAGFVVLAFIMVGSQQHATGGLDLKQANVDARISNSDRADELPLHSATIIGKPSGKQYSAMPWKFQALSADQRTITIIYVAGDGSCVRPVGVVVAQSKNFVALSPYSSTNADHACADMLVLARATVTLSAPLGSRELLHPVIDPAWQSAARNL